MSTEQALARIRSFKEVAGRTQLHPTEVDAEWSVVETNEGAKYLQISTFGSDSRASEPKVSQTIQLDEDLARELVRAIDMTFGR